MEYTIGKDSFNRILSKIGSERRHFKRFAKETFNASFFRQKSLIIPQSMKDDFNAGKLTHFCERYFEAVFYVIIVRIVVEMCIFTGIAMATLNALFLVQNLFQC